MRRQLVNADRLAARSFHKDRERDNKLTALGFEVLRLSYCRLNEEPQAVAALVRARLERRR